MQHIQKFRDQLSKLLQDAEREGRSELLVRAGDLHSLVGGYPAPRGAHRMPICCDAMRQAMDGDYGDEIVGEPEKGKGANLEIRYILPRPSSSSVRSPSWSRDELILALDLYFQHPPSHISKKHSAVIELSDLLNVIGERLGIASGHKFRNPNGVYMKLCNFLRLDPTYHGTGLKSGGKLEEEVWNEFSWRRTELHDLALAIRAVINTAGSGAVIEIGQQEDESEFAEGAVLFRTHLQRERNRQLVETAKRNAKAKRGSLACQACGFDFESVYGTEYIECHHTIPVSQLRPGSKTKIEDVALVCANCHRMIHRKRPWLTMQGLSRVLQARKAQST